MARIHTYVIDNEINDNDKLLGSEYATNATKNYPVRALGEHLRDNGIVTGGIQLVYSFQQDSTEYTNGQFMLSTSGGNAAAMSAITSIVINKAEIGGLDIEVLLRQMFTDNIAIYGADVKNTFGEYEAGAITENDTSLVVALTVVAHNGSLVNGDRYYISKIPAAIASWGNINGTITNQTDLVNYVASQMPNVPFETVSDIVNALNNLDEFRLQSSVDFRPENFGIGDEANEYTFPSPLTASEKYGYFLFSDSNGVLNWKLFPLDFITGFDEGAKVDGGTF